MQGGRMKVTIKYLGAFSDVCASKEEVLELDEPLVGALIERLIERNGEKFHRLIIDPSTETLRGGATLLVNGYSRDFTHRLCDGDEVALLTPVVGG
jgi:molybdopterin converting factor small subunit